MPEVTVEKRVGPWEIPFRLKITPPTARSEAPAQQDLEYQENMRLLNHHITKITEGLEVIQKYVSSGIGGRAQEYIEAMHDGLEETLPSDGGLKRRPKSRGCTRG